MFWALTNPPFKKITKEKNEREREILLVNIALSLTNLEV